jgi:hypothetical protein
VTFKGLKKSGQFSGVIPTTPRAGKMATKTASPQTLDELKTEARRNWNRWARDLVAGNPMPPARELIDAGILLGFQQPGDQLEQDAAIVRKYKADRETFDHATSAQAEINKANEAVDERITALERELDELREKRGCSIAFSFDRANARRRMVELTRRYPALFEGEVIA